MSKKLYQDIKDFKFQIQILKTKIPAITNQLALNNHIKLINSMITMVNNLESVMQKEYRTDVIDKLILALLYQRIWREEEVPFSVVWLKMHVLQIDEVLKNPISFQYEYLAEMFYNQQQNEIISIGENSTVVLKQLQEMTPKQEYCNRLTDLLLDFKTAIKWN